MFPFAFRYHCDLPMIVKLVRYVTSAPTHMYSSFSCFITFYPLFILFVAAVHYDFSGTKGLHVFSALHRCVWSTRLALNLGPGMYSSCSTPSGLCRSTHWRAGYFRLRLTTYVVWLRTKLTESDPQIEGRHSRSWSGEYGDYKPAAC